MLFYNSACCWTVQCQPAEGEAAFKSASDALTPEECQMQRLHPKKGFETSQQRALQHPMAATKVQGSRQIYLNSLSK